MRTGGAVRVAGLVVAIVLIANLFVIGAQPIAVGLIPSPWDKLAHLALFAALGALLVIAADGRRAWLVLAALVAVAIADELLQAGLPGRVASVADLAADVVGAAVGVAAMAFAIARRVSL